jgi:DNA-binding PadR family transcriptional regulator
MFIQTYNNHYHKLKNINIVREVLKMNLSAKEELILLAILGMSNESYGARITEDVSKASEGQIDLDCGFRYPALGGLKRRGFLRSLSRNHISNTSGGYRASYYEVTELGKQALKNAYIIRERLCRKDLLFGT